MTTLEEIIELISLTGDKCFILKDNNPAIVVMKIEDYRKLLPLNQGKTQQNQDLGKPTTDIKVYEVPKKLNAEDVYYPEPLK